MYKGKSIATVIPAYNEEKLIRRVIDSMPAFVDKIIVVNDCSKDQTADIVNELQKENPDLIILINHDRNQGVGAAIATGYKWCRDHEMDIAAVMAGDSQMDPNDLPALLDPVADDKVDYSKGNRLFTGEAWLEIPWIRYLGNSVLSILTKIASGYWHVADSQSGYTAINLKALKTINWDKMYKRYGQPNDLLVRLNINNFRVCDVPVRPVYNIGEKSGIQPIRIIPKIAILLIFLFSYRMFHKYIIRDTHPLVFFYLIGFLLLLTDIPFAIRFVLLYRLHGTVPEITLLILLFLSILGSQFIMFAMWFDMEYNRNLKG